ncbi:MAG: hypothetical protein JO152_11440, partial [Mycobacteriaceae bacterium]|nr:hypothetical protein [Mycobacteriaceae bacterium]
MNETHIRAQYSTGLSRHNIEQAIVAAGFDVDHLKPPDLDLIEEYCRTANWLNGLVGLGEQISVHHAD